MRNSRGSRAVLLVVGLFLCRITVVTAAGAQNVAAGSTTLRVAPVSSRVLVADPIAANLTRRALAVASRQLGTERCQTLLTEFRDPAGRMLGARLTVLETTVHDYLPLIYFRDGIGSEQCARGAMAFAVPGSPVVYVCSASLERSWQRDPRNVVAGFIHEVLHTLGLGENPPSSADITARVLASCRE
jgi:hypothetical protein